MAKETTKWAVSGDNINNSGSLCKSVLQLNEKRGATSDTYRVDNSIIHSGRTKEQTIETHKNASIDRSETHENGDGDIDWSCYPAVTLHLSGSEGNRYARTLDID